MRLDKSMPRGAAIREIRRVLRDLNEGAAHQAGNPPDISEIFAPQEHGAALDPDRTLVIGNRGVGKTFWATSLVDNSTRAHIAKLPVYRRLDLANVEAVIGFDGSYSGVVAPSRDVIDACQKAGAQPRRIWEAVLLRYSATRVGASLPQTLRETALWLQENVEEGEALLRRVDSYFADQGKRFLIVFDALDTLGDTWAELRPRLKGLLEFARLTKGMRSIRTKLFLRVDQAQDRELWGSPDLSKLYNERVRLNWSQYALYELLFFHLHREARLAFKELAGLEWLPRTWSEMEHRSVFTKIAGAYMGSGAKRGNTYDWVINHLADADEETTPRAFLVTLKAAAEHHPEARPNVIDHLDIQAGVVRASEGRVKELEEDYWWIGTAFEPLEGVSVPCLPEDFDIRWSDAQTAEKIRRQARREKRLTPLTFEPHVGDLIARSAEASDEERLRRSLDVIGVLEERRNGRINVPDIFRVAARIKRRGGVKPPPRARHVA
jgi:hypothetical protein